MAHMKVLLLNINGAAEGNQRMPIRIPSLRY